MQEHNFFPTKVFTSNKILNNKDMLEKLYTLQKNNFDYFSGGWQSKRNIYKLNEFFPLVDYIKNSLFLVFKKSVTILDMWGTISPQNSYNKIHNHPSLQYTEGLLWSGVYYIKTFTNSGFLNIHSPMNPSNIEQLSPIPGDLILFRANTYHSVSLNLESQDRVSIAFNLILNNE
jgi:hypothetical protein